MDLQIFDFGLREKTRARNFFGASFRFLFRQSKIQNRSHKSKMGWAFRNRCRARGVRGEADAQQTGKIFRIGFLDPSTASGSAVLVDAFRQELSKLGWIEGKNITIEYRFAEQKT